MNIAGNILSIVLLCGLAVQDFRSRTISAWLLPAVVAALLLAVVDTNDLQFLIYPNLVVNVTLLTLQFVLLWLFVSLRQKAWTNIINTQIGTGDILLLLCLSPFFSPLNFFVLFVGAILLALILALIARAITPQANKHIPFAGILGIPLIALCVLRLVFPDKIGFSNNEWLELLLS